MFYQPIADTKTGKIRGMEALLRWELEPYGMVSPGVFMEWLEQDPCIFDLGNWILRTALTDVQKLRKETEGFSSMSMWRRHSWSAESSAVLS